ncbi:MAG: hypothetical protein V1916_01705 [Patescibacteria group bacterium]
MGIHRNQRGVSALFITLFGLLALSVVLLDGIAVSAQQRREAQAGTRVATNNCGQMHVVFPAQCPITAVYRCGGRYILRTDCVGVGDVVLDSRGGYQGWCGYTSFDGPSPTCQGYNTDHTGTDCTKGTNLCTTS